MPEELDLLASIAGKGSSGFQASILTSFNVHFPFYEDVLLRRLTASGCRYNVLLCDSACLTKSMNSATEQPRLAGHAYTLIPVKSQGAFHPKIGLFLGKKRVRAVVGSHNITLAGFGHNRELTTYFDLPQGKADPDAHIAGSIWQFLSSWIRTSAEYVPHGIIDSVIRTVADNAPWINREMASHGEVMFLGAKPSGENLWSQVRPLLPEKARQIVVLGPFFDTGGHFLRILANDLIPQRLVIGVEKDAVSLPLAREDWGAMTFVDTSEFMQRTGYLHAKAIWIDGEDGQTALITGSANPSGPAWTAAAAERNAEAVVVQLGDRARGSVAHLDFPELLKCPVLGKESLREIVSRSKERLASPQSYSSTPVLVAEFSGDRLFICCSDLSPKDVTGIRYFGDDPCKIFKAEHFEWDASGIRVPILPGTVSRIRQVEIELANGQFRHAIVHHPASIAQLSRTPAQQKFRDSLNSLDGDSPDLPTVLRLASKLIFDESAQPKSKPTGKKTDPKNGADKSEHEQLGSLAVSIDETKHRKKKLRQLRGSDLAYIIDILIYRLGAGVNEAEDVLPVEKGPSEEEQVGMEDEPVVALTVPEPLSFAKTCHAKVRTLVNRMVKQLDRPESKNDDALSSVDQLLAVLAVLREIRARDARLSEIAGGQSLVPSDQRRKLLVGACQSLFSAKKRLFDRYESACHDDPENDRPRLAGLLLWLAWDSQVDARSIEKSDRYDRDWLDERLMEMAMLLEILAVTEKHEGAYEEAMRSIWRVAGDSKAHSSSKWLSHHRRWIRRGLRGVHDRCRLKPAITADPGDFGIVITEQTKRIRLVLGRSFKFVRLAEIGKKDNEAGYIPDVVNVIKRK